MNKKLELLALLFIGNNHVYGNQVINLIRRKVLNNDKSFESIINYLKEITKVKNYNE